MKKNILLTSSGRRNYLIEYFKKVVGVDGKVFAADMTSSAASLQEADKAFIVPSVADDAYITTILKICLENEISLVVPLNDLELPVLACSKDTFLKNGIMPLVSSSEVIETCFNKFKTAQFMKSMGLVVPVTYKSLEDAVDAINKKSLSMPVVVKPCYGSGSLGIYVCYDEEELVLAYQLLNKQLSRSPFGDFPEKIIIQEKLKGQEYGLDILNDLNGNYVATSVKKKLVMRAGETDRAVTVNEPILLALGEKIARNLQHIGNLDCDIFWNKITPPVVLEMNPRFGGGYPFSYVAGFDVPQAVMRWLNGVDVKKTDVSVNSDVASSKCDRLVRIKDIGAYRNEDTMLCNK